MGRRAARLEVEVLGPVEQLERRLGRPPGLLAARGCRRGVAVLFRAGVLAVGGDEGGVDGARRLVERFHQVQDQRRPRALVVLALQGVLPRLALNPQPAPERILVRRHFMRGSHFHDRQLQQPLDHVAK